MTDQNDPTPPTGGQQNIAELERAIDDARQKLAAMLEQQRAARTQVLFAFVAILAIMLIWGFMTFSAVKENLSMEKLEAVAKQHGPLYMDQAKTILQRSIRGALPTYRNLAIEKAKAMVPDLRESAKRDVSALAQDIQTDVNHTIDNAMSRIESAVNAAIREKFAYATHGGAMDNLVEQLHDQHAVVQQDVNNIIHGEVKRVRDVLVKFKVPDASKTEAPELEKDMLKVGLEYALYELRVSGTDEGLNWNVFRAPENLTIEPVGDVSIAID